MSPFAAATKTETSKSLNNPARVNVNPYKPALEKQGPSQGNIMPSIIAKRGDFVCVEREHVATFLDASIGRLVTRSTLCGDVWNVARDGTAKTVRTPDGYIRKIGRGEAGYVAHYVVSATRIDVAKAVAAAQGKDTPSDVREAVRPFLETTAEARP
jgi:hypothetical protein